MPYLPERPAKLPRETPRIYVLRFNDGRLKAGRSCNVLNRISSLNWDPFKTGVRVVGGWYSEGHAEAEFNEMRLILFCREKFGLPARGTTESFNGDFEATVAYAQSLLTTTS